MTFPIADCRLSIARVLACAAAILLYARIAQSAPRRRRPTPCGRGSASSTTRTPRSASRPASVSWASVKDLPRLRELVAGARPLRPSQATALHDIVTHVWLASEPYPSDASAGGFLGLSWSRTEEQGWVDPPGLLVSMRVPGFCAYRHLRDGDVVIGIAEFEGQQFVHSSQLTSVLKEVRPGTTLNFLVVRGGLTVRVPIALDALSGAAQSGHRALSKLRGRPWPKSTGRGRLRRWWESRTPRQDNPESALQAPLGASRLPIVNHPLLGS